MIDAIINDILEDDTNVVEIDLELWDMTKKELVDTYLFSIDLTRIGLDKDMDYAFQLSKDLKRIVNKIMREKNRIPSIEEITDEVYKINYITIENF